MPNVTDEYDVTLDSRHLDRRTLVRGACAAVAGGFAGCSGPDDGGGGGGGYRVDGPSAGN